MFDKPEYYFNRELSWLKFNQRVLQEAIDTSNPLLERLRFIAITSSNMDEFFMIRVSGLKHYVENNVLRYDAAHMSPQMQLDAIAALAKSITLVQEKYKEKVLGELESYGLCFKKTTDLTEAQQTWLRNLFLRNIYPVVTPLAVDSSHPFPFLANRTINTVVSLHRNGKPEEKHVAILPLPSVLDRIIEVPSESEQKIFVLLEEVILHYADNFFLGHTIDSHLTFRVTRDADLEISEEISTDLLSEVERSLRMRRKGMAVRIEAQMKEETDQALLDFIMENLQLKEEDLYKVKSPLDARMYFGFCDIEGYDNLRYKPYTPCRAYDLIDEEGTIFDAIRKKDVFVHHPFESFDAVEQFVEQAASDPQVLAIKQTLYRVSSKSPIVAALAKAADNGKQVTVLMEVKARFDEENNIIMARRLEKAGCHVIYGLMGLKTHSKITMVVRRDEDGIRRYVHLGTGNYNGSTAKLYTDCGIFTCNDEYGEDASAFFNLISGYSDPPIWNKFGVAPLNLREKIVAAIDDEINHARRGEEAKIIAKMNSLLDQDIIRKLYEASTAGVQIELIVRGICTLRPGIEGVSENIRVRSIVGRFLEHHRLFYFRHGGKERVFLSSADWMPRNLNDRVELLVPIEEPAHKKRVINILKLYLSDNTKAHMMRSNGTYFKRVNKEDPVNAQLTMCKLATERMEKPKVTIIERMQPMYKNK